MADVGDIWDDDEDAQILISHANRSCAKHRQNIDNCLANPKELADEIESLKQQLEGERAAALNYRNDAIEAGKKCDGLVSELEAARKDAGRISFLEETVLAAKMRGVSFDYIKHSEDGLVTEKGFRFMKYHFIGEPEKSIRAAIDAAIEQASSCNELHEKGGV